MSLQSVSSRKEIKGDKHIKWLAGSRSQPMVMNDQGFYLVHSSLSHHHLDMGLCPEDAFSMVFTPFLFTASCVGRVALSGFTTPHSCSLCSLMCTTLRQRDTMQGGRSFLQTCVSVVRGTFSRNASLSNWTYDHCRGYLRCPPLAQCHLLM